MNFPYIIEAYKPTKQGDAVVATETIYNEYEELNFKNRYSHLKFKTKPVSQSLEEHRPIAQSVTTTPSKKNSAHNTKSWYEKAIFTHLIFPIIAAVVAGIILYILFS